MPVAFPADRALPSYHLDVARPTPTLVVATWNIRAAIGPGEPFPPAWWRHVRADRLARIAEVIRALDADVVTLQEVGVYNVDGSLHDQPAELAAATGMDVRYAAAGHFPVIEPEDGRVSGTSLWGNAVLSRLPIAASWAAGLPRAADDEVVEPLGAVHPHTGEAHPLAGVRYADAPTGVREPRCVLRVTVETGEGPVDVLSTHFTHVGGEQRRTQAAFTATLADASAGSVVVAGDLNAAIDAPALEPLTASLVDAFAATGTPVGSRDRLSCGPWPIDQVLVRGLTPRSCGVRHEAGDASDHLPVVAELALP
jgi:endonuclease/exonuclease/phosphatase family metal-dependent hydrolase